MFFFNKMSGLNLSIWNRVQYPSKNKVLLMIRDTGLVSLIVGVCAFTVTLFVSKTVAMLVYSF